MESKPLIDYLLNTDSWLAVAAALLVITPGGVFVVVITVTLLWKAITRLFFDRNG